MVETMDMFAWSGTREEEWKRRRESGSMDRGRDAGSRHPSPDVSNDPLNPVYKDPRELSSSEESNSFETTLDEVSGSNPAPENLIDLLYNKGCISLLHKRHIEQQPTRQLRNLEMLQLIKNGSNKTFNVALEFFRATHQDNVFDMLNRKYSSEEIQLSEYVETKGEKILMGVAWLEDKIYVISQSSNIVQVYSESGQKSQDKWKLENIELKKMTNLRDMAASQPSRSLFMCDIDNRCLWRIQMPGREISRWDIEGNPGRISISTSGELIICVNRCDRALLIINRSSDVIMMETIYPPTEVGILKHAVQLMNGNLMISYALNEAPAAFKVGELSIDGRYFIRSFDPRSVGMQRLYYWTPYHVSIDEAGNMFCADLNNYRVVQLNSRLSDVQILLSRVQQSIRSPWRICYVGEKQQLIVCQRRSGGATHEVLVFDLVSTTTSSVEHQTRESELEVIRSGSLETDEMNAERMDILYPMHHIPDIHLIQRFLVKDEKEESFVKGVTWLENKIYFVCRGSNRMHVFPDQEPFEELKNEEIKIKSMKQPWDISASKVSRSIFISDLGSQCLWKVQIPGREINSWKIEGMPSTLSITSTDNLIVVISRADRHHLDFYSCCLNVERTQSITLPTQIKEVLHALQSSNRFLIISYSTKNLPGVYQISELSTDGRNFLRTFDLRSVGSMNMATWKPDHMTFDPEDGQLFIADYRHFWVYMLSSQLTDPHMLLKRFQHQLDGPSRLCYVQDKQQLIVGQTGFVGESGLVSEFNLRVSRQKQERDVQTDDQ